MCNTATAVWALKHQNITSKQKVSFRAGCACLHARMKLHLVGMLLPLEPIVFPSRTHTH